MKLSKRELTTGSNLLGFQIHLTRWEDSREWERGLMNEVSETLKSTPGLTWGGVIQKPRHRRHLRFENSEAGEATEHAPSGSRRAVAVRERRCRPQRATGCITAELPWRQVGSHTGATQPAPLRGVGAMTKSSRGVARVEIHIPLPSFHI